MLKKWYFDVVTPNGEAAIAYRAHLAYGPVRLQYASQLISRPDQASAVSTSLAPSAEPLVSHSAISWNCPPLNLDVTAAGDPSSHAIELLPQSPGAVRWTPWLMNAQVRINTTGATFAGRGYAEEISLAIPAWDLPIDRVHWGRWIGARTNRTWIRWEGDRPMTLLLPDPQDCCGAEITTDRVTGPATNLWLEHARTIRDAPLGASALANIPGLRSWAPAAMLASVETKWLSRGTLRQGTTVVDEGWAIHELVRFRECT